MKRPEILIRDAFEYVLLRHSPVGQIGYDSQISVCLVTASDFFHRFCKGLRQAGGSIWATLADDVLQRVAAWMVLFRVVGFPPPLDQLYRVYVMAVSIRIFSLRPTDLRTRMRPLPGTGFAVRYP